MDPKTDYYIGYTAKGADNIDGNLVILLDNGPNEPIKITVLEEDAKEPVMGLVLIKATKDYLTFAHVGQEGPKNEVKISVKEKEVEIEDPRYPPGEAEAELPPDPSVLRVQEGPEQPIEGEGDAGQEEAEESKPKSSRKSSK